MNSEGDITVNTLEGLIAKGRKAEIEAGEYPAEHLSKRRAFDVDVESLSSIKQRLAYLLPRIFELLEISDEPRKALVAWRCFRASVHYRYDTRRKDSNPSHPNKTKREEVTRFVKKFDDFAESLASMSAETRGLFVHGPFPWLEGKYEPNPPENFRWRHVEAINDLGILRRHLSCEVAALGPPNSNEYLSYRPKGDLVHDCIWIFAVDAEKEPTTSPGGDMSEFVSLVFEAASGEEADLSRTIARELDEIRHPKDGCVSDIVSYLESEIQKMENLAASDLVMEIDKEAALKRKSELERELAEALKRGTT